MSRPVSARSRSAVYKVRLMAMAASKSESVSLFAFAGSGSKSNKIRKKYRERTAAFAPVEIGICWLLPNDPARALREVVTEVPGYRQSLPPNWFGMHLTPLL